MIRAATSKRVTQKREGQTAHVAMHLSFKILRRELVSQNGGVWPLLLHCERVYRTED